MHLFIVNERTLPVSLKYGFAGTTLPKEVRDWGSAAAMNGNDERNQASLYADICGVHRGDEVLFYLQTPTGDSRREGGYFLGLFKCESNAPFFEPGGSYLLEELDLPLCYRLLIGPSTPYAKGLTEWYMMDEMVQFRQISDVPWTLIYRKMTARRGCTPLLPHEASLIKRMLDLKNGGQSLAPSGIGYDEERFMLSNGMEVASYGGRTDNVPNIGDRLRSLVDHPTRGCELHLQAFLMQEIGRSEELTTLLFPNVKVDWVGNEIYCGAGKQAIDILVYTSNGLNHFIHLLELKGGQADSDAASQLNRYVMWLRAHVPGITAQQIIPTIVCKESTPLFHSQLKTHLQGHGIETYREVHYNSSLECDLLIKDV